MTEKHSPLPWFVDGPYVTDRGDGTIGLSIADCGKSPRIPSATHRANAALIVRSVNGLPEAIAALELARKNLNGNDLVAEKIDAALTKLKG